MHSSRYFPIFDDLPLFMTNYQSPNNSFKKAQTDFRNFLHIVIQQFLTF